MKWKEDPDCRGTQEVYQAHPFKFAMQGSRSRTLVAVLAGQCLYQLHRQQVIHGLLNVLSVTLSARPQSTKHLFSTGAWIGPFIPISDCGRLIRVPGWCCHWLPFHVYCSFNFYIPMPLNFPFLYHRLLQVLNSSQPNVSFHFLYFYRT